MTAGESETLVLAYTRLQVSTSKTIIIFNIAFLDQSMKNLSTSNEIYDYLRAEIFFIP